MGCGGGENIAPSTKPPARLDAVSDLSRTAVVGAPVPNGLVVKVSDEDGRPVQGATVAFAVTLGNGFTSPRVATTDAKGEATAAWTLGTIVGPNEVTASVSTLSGAVKFEASGTAGPVNAIAFSSQNVRLLVNSDTARITATSIDAFGNPASPAPTLVVRDPTLVNIDASGLIHAARRGASTYVVATAAGKVDSALVTVLAAGQSICTAAAAPVTLVIGQVVASNVSGSGFCVHADAAGAEYALIPYYNSDIPSATTQIEVRGQGITPPPLPVASLLNRAAAAKAQLPPTSLHGLVPDDAFESRLRDRERNLLAGRATAARSWMRARRDASVASTAAALPAVGDLIKFNINANDPCDSIELRTGRVAAVTDKAIVVADTGNPSGGFTNEEYRSIGVTFDTLVDPTDRAAFGAPSDIDNNGHVILFFTKAVNALSSAGSGSVVLGFFYQRDLFPKTGTSGTCAGSNVAEMFYLVVPDTGATAGPNRLSKAQVVSIANGTAAHEYQHLINASRRLYVNGVGTNFEEKWLDEGLAHTAEELNFWKATGLSPRSNLGAPTIADPRYNAAYQTFELNNVRRYATYLGRTESQSPIGVSSLDDDLQTRGAIWNFLRYAADHLAAGAENKFWFGLVNSKTAGIANLTAALGAPPNALMRDWAISVFMDDNASNVDARFLQPSWNMRSVLTGGGVSLAFPLATRMMTDDAPTIVPLTANGVSFLRFSVPSGQDALLTVTASGQQLPATVQLAVVRVR